MAAKKTESTLKKPSTYKGLLILKSRGQLPRGLKTSVGTVSIGWYVKGETYFSMSLADFAKSAATSLGFR